MPKKLPPAEALARRLRVKSTPDPTSRANKSHGKRTSLGVYSFLETLFDLNECLPANKKMTDAEIARQVCIEYPDRPIAQHFIKKTYTVNYYRIKFNNGTLFKDNKIPPRRSWRYNDRGQRVDGRTGKHPI